MRNMEGRDVEGRDGRDVEKRDWGVGGVKRWGRPGWGRRRLLLRALAHQVAALSPTALLCGPVRGVAPGTAGSLGDCAPLPLRASAARLMHGRRAPCCEAVRSGEKGLPRLLEVPAAPTRPRACRILRANGNMHIPRSNRKVAGLGAK